MTAMTAPFTLVVPCSTSNLGAGFDALGIALGGPDLLVRFTPGGEGLRIARLSGEGATTLPKDATNRIIVAARAHAALRGLDPEGLAGSLEVHTAIPLKRGLGSSAAAAVAGAMLAERLHGETVDLRRVIATAVKLEGHPDNVLPSVRGGVQVAVTTAAGEVLSCPVKVALPLRAALFIPDVELSTEAARAVLPRTVSLGDAVFNLGRSALFVAALTEGRYELLAEAMEDKLHQSARGTLLPWLAGALSAARAAGAYGASLSGAGSTAVALCAPESVREVAAAMRDFALAQGVTGRAETVDVGVPGAGVRA
jgi:homoserine kinase